MRWRRKLSVTVAYPGVLGVTTDKGQQDVKPNVLDAPTESYEIMLLRWQTGVFEVGADAPQMDNGDAIQGIPVIIALSGGIPVTQINYEGAPEPLPAAPIATVSNNGYGLTITLVNSGGTPMNLFNLDGTPYQGGIPIAPTGFAYASLSDLSGNRWLTQVIDSYGQQHTAIVAGSGS